MPKRLGRSIKLIAQHLDHVSQGQTQLCLRFDQNEKLAKRELAVLQLVQVRDALELVLL